MDWKLEYNNRLVSKEEAVKHIESGDRVVIGHAVGEPTLIIEAMVANKSQYENVEIVHMVPMGKGEYLEEGMEKHFRHNAIFVGGSTREAVNSGRADYTPCFFSEVPRLFRDGSLPVDVALISVSKPDENGYCSLGTSVDYTKEAAKSAKITIAQINEEMPRTMGDSNIHVSELDYIVEGNMPIPVLNPPKISEVERAIGEHCASLVEDGSTLQLGIGAIPDAVLLFLKDKKDLGIHSEMISDGVVELYEAGVITNKMKTLHPGKMVVTFLMGTKRLYDFVNNNPELEMYPVDYVNDPCVIMQNYKMVSINSCIQVDLMGQVVSDTVGKKQFSGVGGQVDFVRGASMAKDGKSIIAMPSTAAKGKISRIVPIIDEGAAVTTSRNDVHYVVTEYGVANLKGKTLKARGRALINIAHPDFRDQLIKEWEIRFSGKF
ncbi:acetyl-CoA hydrolase/transferase family protein [Tissierella pigra]|uniref:Acetyl-CoA hydrolase/transferase family protein n=1 Tax=Tissierella pigra TaxID=2607614 RepID=A0A6N7XEN5_9FIRM|nr:acetyl-CoA hydrolase/transferase C-terminal domain-containing protein [Tissierella pigra]MBU5425421.1 acetyl-CoA hydrolase/transferase family protein [Tissierella pigra]MSU00541.1 acetyl-CoA hydrolase/transferase family protein [Tissierella pigra]